MKLEIENTVIAIRGMTCEECIRKVRTAIDSVAGVRVGSVQIGRAVVQCENAIACERACEAIEDAGFSARKKSAIAFDTVRAAGKKDSGPLQAGQDLIYGNGGSAGMTIDGSHAPATENNSHKVQKSQSARE